ncbi:hypothetical protein ACG873_02775 [Mesorhizobium sp. AaZ16]|uniref:hypothetical protein n=1 Tax=Mesorhizobium sp. AaZ16 TaxID=3402289 RepID=UPI00374F6931
MTGINRSGRSRTEKRAGRAGEASSSRSQSSLAPGEGGQSFDAVVEQMRSVGIDRRTPAVPLQRGVDDAPRDRPSGPSVGIHRTMDTARHAAAAPRAASPRRRSLPSMSEGEALAPVASRPPTSGVAVPISLSSEEINEAKRRMHGLLTEMTICYNASRQDLKSPELLDRVVAAGSAVLEYYASLPRPVARTIMDDTQVRSCRDLVCGAVNYYSRLAEATSHKLQGTQKASKDVFSMIQSTATPDQLSRADLSVVKAHVACVDWWEKKVGHCERERFAWAAAGNLPSATAEMRQGEEAGLRLSTGGTLYAKVVHLQTQIGLARVKIEPQVSTFEAPVRELLIGENGRVRLLGDFVGDVGPAFLSASDAVTKNKGRPLDAEHCAVLEGVMERLSEFASAFQVIRTKLNDHQTDAGLPLELLSQIVEGAWIIAHDVMHYLELQPKPPAVALPADAGAAIPAEDAGAAIPAETAGKAAMAEGAATRKKGKGKDKPAAGAGSSAAGRPEPQVAAAVSDPAPAPKVLVRSDLGTKKLVSAEDAQKSASAAAEKLAIWQAPASPKALTPRLERLDELLQFDLAGQQRTISQALQMKPEDVEHAVDTVVERLQTQATEMQACLAALEDFRLRLLLPSTQVPKVNEKTAHLKDMLSQAKGLAKTLTQQKEIMTIECMKTYAFPSQKYLEHLRAAGQLKAEDRPRALKVKSGEPGSLFEIRLQPTALRNGATPNPVWVHIHTNRPVHTGQLPMLDDADFAACHVKSDEQRGHNRQWQDRRAAWGHDNAMIHRGKLTPAFCKSLLTT